MVDTEKRYQLKSGKDFTVGRGLDNTLTIEEIAISRNHCTFKELNGFWCVVDKSSNGIRINETRPGRDAATFLSDGDIVKLSDNTSLRFVDSPATRAIDANLASVAEQVENATAHTTRLKGPATRKRTANQALSAPQPPPPLADTNAALILLSKQISHDNTAVVLDVIEIDSPSPAKRRLLPAAQADVVATTSTGGNPTGATTSCSVNEMSASLSVSAQQAVATTSSESVKLNMDDSDLTCSICMELFVNSQTLNCSHTFCGTCINEWMKKNKVCPICRVKITSMNPTRLVDNFVEKYLSSAPADVQQKRKELLEERKASKAGPAAASAAGTSSGRRGIRRGGARTRRRAARGGTPVTRRGRGASSPAETVVISSGEDSSDEWGFEGLSDSDDAFDVFLEGDEFDEFDDYEEEDFEDFMERTPPFGACYCCGSRTHWANRCPHRNY